ncbi:hypothetical protein Rxycam_02626 [Rubrobacter xylanophilus DSM 9941]|uniref:YkvA family protein n=1 Tax=Rubrobacter xylanophilus TaxID=49319 RepID=UPI001C643229|nr:YkvA family protein [Rubrobacter xylanophilus]QYJ16790.1 hypothetical protein Rxycam_02626 [Rubrobacter xylanophilus DSM 9941]
MSAAFGRLRGWARRTKAEVHALYLAYRDPRTPLHARLFAALVMAYALSPIDLIPDAIPVLGHLDDLLLVPLGVALAVRMIPPHVLEECRKKARENPGRVRPAAWGGVVVVAGLWLLLLGLAALLLARAL